jgi:thiol-disulfide isomerase/thioredoxin
VTGKAVDVMNKFNCALGTVALLVLSACNQGAKSPDRMADLAPHPLAGQPAAPDAAPPKPEALAVPPTAEAAAPPAGKQLDRAAPPAMPEEAVPQIPPEYMAEMEKDALAEVKAQLKKGPRPATDFAYIGFDGKPGSLKSQFGEPLVVNFWAPWCPPCKAELPDFSEVYNAKPGRFKLLGVCTDDQEDPPGYVQRHGYNWQFVYDQTHGSAYQIESIPRTLFINRKGQLVVDYSGLMPRKAFEAALAKIV